MSSPLCPPLCCVQLGDSDLGGYTPAVQRRQTVSRGSLASEREVPGNVVSVKGVFVDGQVTTMMMRRATVYRGLSRGLTSASEQAKLTGR